MRVLVLGHRGLLGNCVVKYLSSFRELKINTTESRWPDFTFVDFLKKSKFEWIVNCIAQVPQAEPLAGDLFITNLGLPVFLSTLDSNVIHPSSNDLSGESEYSLSKQCAERIIRNFCNTFIIRCSIIGVEQETNKSLLSWFLSSKEKDIKGYTNSYWNGITTLEWAKLCCELINRRRAERLIIPFTDTLSKYELLIFCRSVFNKKIEIQPAVSSKSFFVSAENTTYLGHIEAQLLELKRFYNL
jgi:dTDP-4-dehydrorhamnose reductase